MSNSLIYPMSLRLPAPHAISPPSVGLLRSPLVSDAGLLTALISAVVAVGLILSFSMAHLPVVLAWPSRYCCSMTSRLWPLVSNMHSAHTTVQRKAEPAKK